MENKSRESADNANEKDLFLLQNKLLFKKFYPIKQIGKGTFSTVYLSLNIKTNDYVALKVEKRTRSDVELLEKEAFLLYALRGFGIPEVLSYGRTKAYNILVMPLLGKNLLDLFLLSKESVNINDVCCVAIQILDRIEWVHSNNIVYRDIKPENFLFGKNDKNILYLIDFGLCRKYKSSKTGIHITPRNMGKFTGTSRYASVYAMAGNEQSRRDDIESIGYMLIFLIKKKLPWQGIKGNSYKDCYHKLYLMKKNIKLEELCRGLPREIIEYMEYAKYLKFEQEPDYNYLRNIFNRILNKNRVIFEQYIFSWCRNESVNNNRKERIFNSNYKNNNNIEREFSLNKNKNSNKINIKPVEISETSKNNPMNLYNNSARAKNDITSEMSNTNKVLYNRNINSINSGYNDSIRKSLNRYNSEKEYNIISFRGNNNLNTHKSPDIRINHYLNLNKKIPFNKPDDENKKSNNRELKKIIFPKNENRNRKIISISPEHNESITNKRNNSINASVNNNLSNNYSINNNSKNKYNKINQIKTTNINTTNKANKENNYPNNRNRNERIIYNTYNTFNTYNSYNPNIDKSINNNISINNIYPKAPNEIEYFRNYKNILKTESQKIITNNNNNFKIPINKNSRTYLGKNSKSLNSILPKNKLVDQIKYSSIEIKNDNIPRQFSYNNNRNNNNQNSIETALNNKKFKSVNSTKILGYNHTTNKFINNNNYKFTNIRKINSNKKSNSNSNIYKHNNYDYKITKNENIDKLTPSKVVNKKDNTYVYNNEKEHKIQYMPKNNSTNYINANNKSINSIINQYKNNLNITNSMANMKQSNKVYDHNRQKDIYINHHTISNNNYKNYSSLQNNLKNNNVLLVKKPIISYIYKNKKSPNSIIYNNNNHNLNISKNNSYRNTRENFIQNKNEDKNIKNMKEIGIKLEPKMISNHDLKIINSSTNKKNIISSSNSYINKENNFYYENKYKTEEVDDQNRDNNNFRNKLNRINRYKIIRNRATQNH